MSASLSLFLCVCGRGVHDLPLSDRVGGGLVLDPSHLQDPKPPRPAAVLQLWVSRRGFARCRHAGRSCHCVLFLWTWACTVQSCGGVQCDSPGASDPFSRSCMSRGRRGGGHTDGSTTPRRGFSATAGEATVRNTCWSVVPRPRMRVAIFSLVRDHSGGVVSHSKRCAGAWGSSW